MAIQKKNKKKDRKKDKRKNKGEEEKTERESKRRFLVYYSIPLYNHSRINITLVIHSY